MKRRKFLKNAGIGASSVFMASSAISEFEQNQQFDYSDIAVLKKAKDLKDIVNAGGQVMVRLEFMNAAGAVRTDYDAAISVKKGNILRSRKFFFEEGEDSYTPENNRFQGTAGTGTSDVIVLWMDDFSDETIIIINNKKERYSFTLKELVEKEEITIENPGLNVIANYLLDKEIGFINAADAGIAEGGEDYRFTLMADPQGGDPAWGNDLHTRLKIHNAWAEESIRLVNELRPNSLFTLMVGDIVDGQGPEEYFLQMETFFKELQTPILYEIGNHESKYSAKFQPGYSHESLRNYYEAQYRVNGLDKLLYSFNLGKWHYIVWPDPLRKGFWKRHPHYFDWLEKDLEKHRDMPVMVFHHVPVQPIGIDPLIDYSESPYIKRTFINSLAKYENVQYVISGHVHIPLRASIKTAIEHRGMKFINLPAAGYRPRAFGEEDLYGGPTQGIAIVDVRGRDAEISFKNVTGEVYKYADRFPEITSEEYPLWLNYRWELPANEKLRNGDFSSGTDHWIRRYYYVEDQDPSNITRVEAKPGKTGKALYLFSRQRAYNTPGQDRLPQSVNRVAQVIRVPEGKLPLLDLDFMIDEKNFRPGMPNGPYIWIEGYEKSTKRLNISYSVGYYFWHIERNYSQLNEVPSVRMEISSEPGTWHHLHLNPYGDFARHTEMEQVKMDNIDRFIVNLGVWTINDGYDQKTGIWFADLDLKFYDGDRNKKSLLNKDEIAKKDDRFMWWGGMEHVAGEHQIWVEDMNWYKK